MRTVAPAIMAALLLASWALKKTRQSFSEIEEAFIYTTLASSPVSATSAGYHRHQGVNLDQQLDDFSAASRERQTKFYDDMRYGLHEGYPRGGRFASEDQHLSPEDRADYDIIENQINLALFELNEIQ